MAESPMLVLGATGGPGGADTDQNINDPPAVTGYSYAREVISFGFWFGDQTFPEPTFYSHTARRARGAGARTAGAGHHQLHARPGRPPRGGAPRGRAHPRRAAGARSRRPMGPPTKPERAGRARHRPLRRAGASTDAHAPRSAAGRHRGNIRPRRAVPIQS